MQKEELRGLNPTRRVADGRLGCVKGHGNEYLCSADREPLSVVVVVFVAAVALALSSLHEPPYTEPYVRWCGRTAEGDSAPYPI